MLLCLQDTVQEIGVDNNAIDLGGVIGLHSHGQSQKNNVASTWQQLQTKYLQWIPLYHWGYPESCPTLTT